MSKAEELKVQRDQYSMKNHQETIGILADNIFMDGQSLRELYPQIEEYLTMIE